MRTPVISWMKALCVALGLTACGGPTIAYDPANYPKEHDPRKHEYVIGVADELRVHVWRHDDLSGEALVRPDGVITLPLVGDIKVEGNTPTQVRDEVKRRLGTYVKDESAVVTVAVTGVNSYTFTVSGNVANPGTFEATHFVTVSEAVAMAGGPNRFADTDEMVLVRADKRGNARQIPVNYDLVVSHKQPEQDLVLVAGDTIFVP
jgi:polysaccharide biosynthesis/export protein